MNLTKAKLLRTAQYNGLQIVLYAYIGISVIAAAQGLPGGPKGLRSGRPPLYRLQQFPHLQILLLSFDPGKGHLSALSGRSLGFVQIQSGICALFRLVVLDARSDRPAALEPHQFVMSFCRGPAAAGFRRREEELDPLVLPAGNAAVHPEYAKQRAHGRIDCPGFCAGRAPQLCAVNPLHCFLVLY